MFPTFRIKRSDASEVLGTVSATAFGKEAWVADKYLGYLMRWTSLIHGRWHSRGEHWGFVPDEPAALARLHSGEWQIMDGYWGERAELVFDVSRKWKRLQYDGSNHDHCAICWQKLGAGGNPEGYVDFRPSCHLQYTVPRGPCGKTGAVPHNCAQ